MLSFRGVRRRAGALPESGGSAYCANVESAAVRVDALAVFALLILFALMAVLVL